MKNKMIALRSEGKTYREIGEICGVSKQRVYQLIGKADIAKFKEITPEQCVYVGLRNWMNNNKCSRFELMRRIYGEVHPQAYERTKSRLESKNDGITKRFIDKILKITGLTYEEAFKKDEV